MAVVTFEYLIYDENINMYNFWHNFSGAHLVASFRREMIG